MRSVPVNVLLSLLFSRGVIHSVIATARKGEPVTEEALVDPECQRYASKNIEEE